MDPLNVGVEDLLCDESFQRYCRGEDQTDIQYWEAWIRQHPHQKAVVDAAKHLYDVLNLGQGNRIEQLTSLKEAVARRAQLKAEVLNKQETASITPGRVIRFRTRSLLRYAAAIIILVGAGTLAYMKYGKQPASQLHYYEYYTGVNGHKTIMLPDSTIVMLNQNSHLSVSRDFDANHRKVAIAGEAFFDVKHDAAHPFLVNTPQYTIRVLGTTFNVRSYPGKDTTATTLLTGKIEITQHAGGDGEPKVVLKPNQKFILTGSAIATIATTQQPGKTIALNKGEIVKPVMDTTTRRLSETSWARSKMEIKDKTLGEIAEKLQSWYGMKIRFTDDTVKNYRYTATFDDETIFNALRYLQQSYPFSWTIDDGCIVIAKD